MGEGSARLLSEFPLLLSPCAVSPSQIGISTVRTRRSNIAFKDVVPWCLNPERTDLVGTFATVIATWTFGQQPKIPYSSPRTEMLEKTVVHKLTRKKNKTTRLVAAVFAGHADFCNPSNI